MSEHEWQITESPDNHTVTAKRRENGTGTHTIVVIYPQHTEINQVTGPKVEFIFLDQNDQPVPPTHKPAGDFHLLELPTALTILSQLRTVLK